ncbi:MAG: hypothetical protein WBP81_04475, partial [Solirubrobacteraceae bacterium]
PRRRWLLISLDVRLSLYSGSRCSGWAPTQIVEEPAYFVPLARWLVSRLEGWQVWSVERRENLLEDQSVLNLTKRGKATAKQLFDYYLGFLTDPSIKRHFQFIPNADVQFAKQWGMNVAVEDLHRVIAAGRRTGGNVVLGGHSLGGSVVTAYATWNFHGRPGADDLAGLVYIDGGSFHPVRAGKARSELRSLDAANASPWLSFGGLEAPFAGIFSAGGSSAALIAPDAGSIAQRFSLLPSNLKPPVPATNLAQYGYALNVGTSPDAFAAAQAHLGEGVDVRAVNGLHGWNARGALTPINRFATMFSGMGINGTDGTEWYFPLRLTEDTGAVANGNDSDAQKVFDVHATMGHRLPKRLRIYAFGAALGGRAVLLGAKPLARQSRIPMGNLTLVDRHRTYAHNDPAGADPTHVFFAHLLPFLKSVAAT